MRPNNVGSQDQATLRTLVSKYGELNRHLNNEMTATRLAHVSPRQWAEVDELRKNTRLFQFVAGHALNLLDSRQETFAEARNSVKQSLGLVHL